MIYPCPPTINNEQDLRIFAFPYIIQHQVYFFVNENHKKVIIFNLCDKREENNFILAKMELHLEDIKSLLKNHYIKFHLF
jgi:hypothetical protein